MTTINGKLISPPEEELAEAKKQIAILQKQQQSLQKSLTGITSSGTVLERKINSLKGINGKLSRDVELLKIERWFFAGGTCFITLCMVGLIISTFKTSPENAPTNQTHSLHYQRGTNESSS
jgi:hypothetical protein